MPEYVRDVWPWLAVAVALALVVFVADLITN